MNMEMGRRHSVLIVVACLVLFGGLYPPPLGAQEVADEQPREMSEEVEEVEEVEEAEEIQAEEEIVEDGGTRSMAIAFAIALAIGIPCLGAGYAVARVGSAALGAASEKPELLARSLLFVALAEGIAIYGLLVAVLLWVKL